MNIPAPMHPQEGRDNNSGDNNTETNHNTEEVNNNDEEDIDPFFDPFLDDLYNNHSSSIDFIGDPDVFDQIMPSDDIVYNTISDTYINYLHTFNYISYSASDTLMNDLNNPHTKAIIKELQSLIDMKVFEVVQYEDIPEESRNHVMPSYIIVKDKIKADGSFDKCKARCVIGGNYQIHNMYGDTTSSVINATTTTMLLKIATEYDWDVEIYDIPIAYLHVPITNEQVDLYMVFQPNIATLLIQMLIDKLPDIQSYIYQRKLYVKLHKYLYGLKQSAKKFYDFICAWLKTLGYNPSNTDVCLYIKTNGANKCYVGTHVDDMLVTSNNAPDFEQLKEGIKSFFTGDPTIQTGDKLTHLGISIERNRASKTTTLSEEYYIQKLCDTFDKDNNTTENLTYRTSILKTNNKSDLITTNKYLSLLMSIFFVARMTRWDILWVCTYMGSRSNNPTTHDYNQLLIVLRYLRSTMKYKRSFHCNGLTLLLFVDAAHGLHLDGKGHTGLEIRVGNDCIFCKSSKQKVNALSSTEAEVLALAEALTFLEWILMLFKDLLIDVQLPVTICEDNMSTITMVTEGPQFKRAKHMLIKVNYVKQFIDDGRILLKHVYSENMRADHLTKPVPFDLFTKFIADYYKV